MRAPLLGSDPIAGRGASNCPIEVVFSQLKLRRCCPKQWRCFRFRRGGRRVVAQVNARLQLAYPIPARGNSPPRIVLQMLLEAALVELHVIGECEVRRTSTKNPNEPKLRDCDVDYETKPHPANDLEPILRLSLHVAERISGTEKVRDQVDAAIGCIGEVAGAQRRVEGAPQVGAGAKAIEAAFLDEIDAKPSDAEP